MLAEAMPPSGKGVHMMEEEQAFPFGTNLRKTLEAYFTWCSIEITTKSMAMIAATLANGGICPTTTERIFTHQTVTNCLSLMMSCGMYTTVQKTK